MTRRKSVFKQIIQVFLGAFTVVIVLLVMVGTFFVGYVQGYKEGQVNTQREFSGIISMWEGLLNDSEIEKPQQTSAPAPVNINPPSKLVSASWGGPDLWEVVNNRRVQLGVNPLDQRDDLCTIASIRLNDLLDLGDLDGHEGFGNMTERRPDLDPIFQNYSTVAEFLALGGKSAEDTVSLWENTLAHKKLMTGGEYVWGCIYAQDSFAVAIVAF